jgi:hypothetical protein
MQSRPGTLFREYLSEYLEIEKGSAQNDAAF